MIQLLDALDSTADGAFVINQRLKFVYWNQAAEEMLGFQKHEVIGEHCYQVLQGYDEKQRRICVAACQVARTAFDGEPISNYEIQVQTKTGDPLWVDVSIFTYTESGRLFVVHLFRDVDQKKEEEVFFRQLLEVARQYHGSPPIERNPQRGSMQGPDTLSQRELEVLSLLARGHSTKDLAQVLSISTNTVRNHIQHILQKLHVHSRLEAVAYAIQNDLF